MGAYLARRGRDWSDWNRRFDAAVADIRAGIPSEMTPDEIEAEITATWEEYRADGATERHTTAPAAPAGADAGGR